MLARCFLPILLSANLLFSSPLPAAQLPKTTPVLYSDLRFKAEIPVSAEKHVVLASGDEAMRDVYISGDYAYVIRVIKASDTLPTSTAVEKIIQDEITSGTRLGPTQRWELDTQGKQLFKGFTRLADASEPFLEKLFGGKRCVQSTAMASLGDESSPILAVGVMGREDQGADVEALAKYFAFTIDILPAAKSEHKLKKGEIELIGVVEYIGRDAKRLLMRVESVTLPDSAPAKLDSSRLKTVILSELPSGVAVGKRITVTGKNDGVGSPLRADAIQITEAAP